MRTIPSPTPVTVGDGLALPGGPYGSEKVRPSTVIESGNTGLKASRSPGTNEPMTRKPRSNPSTSCTSAVW